jgi:F0F1-type ATP synthase delta subunit
MKTQYSQAFLEVVKDGMPVETALAGLRAALIKKNHSKLLAPVLLEVARVLEAEKFANQAVIKTAKEADHKALKTQIETVLAELGVSNDISVKTVVDETLVGGFVATFDYKEHDQSYKKSLTNLYKSITN